MSATLMNKPTSSWQTLSADLLVLILKPLILQPRASYIPLTCAHVCRHWRRTVSGSPTLWSFVDVARGNALTEFWLSISASCPIDVRFWQPPEEIHTVHTLPHSIQAAIEKTKRHVGRWRSLNISFWCVHCIRDIMAFLESLPEPLELDSLTIGPMGTTTLSWSEEAFATIPEHLMSQRGMKIQPIVLRMDSYPIDAVSVALSPRLRTMVILSEPIEESVNMDMDDALYHRWGSILYATPNLVSLTLWHSCPRGTFLDSAPIDWIEDPVSLPALEYLNLSNRYGELCLLLACSPLPSLKSLTIDSSDGTNFPLYVGKLAAVAPLLSSLTISYPDQPGHVSSQVWREVFQKLQSLQQLTLSEMEEGAVKDILQLETLPMTLGTVRLERISFTSGITWPPPHLTSENPPTLYFAGCDDTLEINSDSAPCLILCRDELEKPNRRDKYKGTAFRSQETDIYMEEDLAIVRGPMPRSTSPSDAASETSGSDDENNDEANSEMDTSSEVSFASGDLYVMELGQLGSIIDDE